MAGLAPDTGLEEIKLAMQHPLLYTMKSGNSGSFGWLGHRLLSQTEQVGRG